MRAVVACVVLAGCHTLFPLDADSPDGGTDDDSGFDGDPRTVKRMFVTFEAFNGDLGGISGADGLCREAAVVPELGGTWAAWISTTNSEVRDRLMMTAGTRYVRIDGQPVANSFNALLAGDLQNPIDQSELGGMPMVFDTGCDDGSGVWTGTALLGATSMNTCSEWNVSASDTFGDAGDYTRGNSDWTLDPGCTTTCDQRLHLYCIEL